MRNEFGTKVKLAAWQNAGGLCQGCGTKLAPGNIAYDHIIPCALGGRSDGDNCQCLCLNCHRGKTFNRDVPTIAKVKRVQAKHIGARNRSRKFAGWRKFDGTIIWRKWKE